MTRAETAGIMRDLRTAYPGFYAKQTSEQIEAAVALWSKAFADDDADVVRAAVLAHITTNDSTSAPVIGQIKRQVYRLTYPTISESEAWTLVREAALGNLDARSLPPLILRAAGGETGLQALAELDVAQRETVAASNFMRTYRDLQAQARDFFCLPVAIRERLPERPDALRMVQANTEAKRQQEEQYYARLRAAEQKRLEEARE